MEDSLELLEDIEEVAEQFFICTRTVRRFVDLFLNTGDVTTEHRKPGPSQCNGLQWRFLSCANEVDACFKASKLREHDQVMHLSTNMCVHLRAGTLAGNPAKLLIHTLSAHRVHTIIQTPGCSPHIHGCFLNAKYGILVLIGNVA